VERLYDWTRDLHLYLGLFLSPMLLIFALSTLLLNHPSRPASGAASPPADRRTGLPVEITGEAGSLDQARQILARLKVTGEIDYVRHLAREQRLVIPVMKPGESIRVEVDLRNHTATIEHRNTGLGAALIYLHKMPGPHNAKYRGSWVYMAWWKMLADVTVWGLLFLTVSGLYLWWLLKAERRIGWVLLAAGMVSLALLVAALSLPSPLVAG
jgi:hypothetical protein